MNILKKTAIFAIPAFMMGCRENRYVITDKDDVAQTITYRDVADTACVHQMTFNWSCVEYRMSPADSMLFRYLNVGDTISGRLDAPRTCNFMVNEHGSVTNNDRIHTVNDTAVSRWIERRHAADIICDIRRRNNKIK